MLRLQSALPEAYTTASLDDLAARIEAAKTALGDDFTEVERTTYPEAIVVVLLERS